MSFSKKTGSLRDFRIDSLSKESLPKQSVKSRQSLAPLPNASSVNEWQQENSGFDSEQMWKVWEEELHTTQNSKKIEAQAVLHTPPPPPSVELQVRTSRISNPLPPQINENLNKVEELTQPKGPLSWAAALAHTERRMERLGEVEYSNSFKKQEILKVQTGEFMAVLRQEFARQIEVFNEARQSGAHAVHLYRITNTDHDFMLFRNSVKLVVSGQRSGRILFAFNQFLGQIYNQNQSPTFELEAQWGAFEQLLWTYRTERVQVQDIVRFFTSEFIRQSYK